MNQPEHMTLKGTLAQREKAARKQTPIADFFSWPGRIALLIALVLSPWAFASVYYWAQFWICVALLIGLGFWWFETAMTTRRTQILPYIGLLVLAGLLLGFLQLVPLPEGVADWVLGRQKEIYENYTGSAHPTYRISLDRDGTWHQIRLLTIALGGLLLGARYFQRRRDLVLLLSVVSINGAVLSFVGILQLLSYNGKILWVYAIGRGSPFGPFINRNNGSGYLLMCFAACLGLLTIVMSQRKNQGPVPIVSKEMPFWRQFNYYILYFISELTATKLAVLFITVLVGMGVLGTLSRGGVIDLLVGGIGTLVIYGVARRPKNSGIILVPLVAMLIGLAVWLGVSDKIIERFSQVDLVNVSDSDARLQQWKDTWQSVSEMGWFGSGLGSYKSVHRLYLSGPESSLFEYAENQYFQSLVEAGWLGLLLFLAAWGMVWYYAKILLFRGQSPTSIAVGTMGVFLLISEATASLFDFGLYIPANLLLMAVLTGFLGYHAHALAGRLKKKTWLRWEVPNWVVQATLLGAFSGLTVVAIGLYRRSQLDRVMQEQPQPFGVTLDLAQTDEQIKKMGPLVERCPTIASTNYLAELFIHRSRMGYYQHLQNSLDYRNKVLLLDETEKQKLDKSTWVLTGLSWMQENAFFMKRNLSRFRTRPFLNQPFLRDNLPIASRYLAASRSYAPLQPVVHLRLGQIAGIFGSLDHPSLEAGNENIERAIQLAPNNASYRYSAGLYYLQTGNVEAAGPHFRRYLELAPGTYSKVITLIKGKSARRIEPIDNRVILDSYIPDNPKMLYRFATTWLKDDPDARTRALKKAEELLTNVSHSRIKTLLLRADVRLALDDFEGATEDLQFALHSNPMDNKVRYRLTKLLFQYGKNERALDEAEKLVRNERKNRSYQQLLQTIKKALDNEKKGQHAPEN